MPDGQPEVLVALQGRPQLARVNLLTDAVEVAYPDGEVLSLAAGGELLFAVVEPPLGMKQISAIDLVGLETIAVLADTLHDRIAFSVRDARLYSARSATSPASLTSYQVTGNIPLLDPLRTRIDLGSNARDLAVSADGAHIVLVCGSGNGSPPYELFDLDAQLDARADLWAVGAYPRAAAFTPDSRHLLVGRDGSPDELVLFSVGGHDRLQAWTVADASCSYQRLQGVAVSNDGATVYAHLDCGFDRQAGRLFWALLPPLTE